MSSRRDQVDAQRYMLARVTGALVRAEPETSESPTRRDRTGTIVGVVLGVLLLGVTAIWALLPGSGSTRWQQPGTLVVDDSTGARYVLASGRLRPVNDVATATLLAGSRLTPEVVASSALADLPQGEPVGTSDGPQVLPSPARLNRGVWRACDLGTGRIGLEVDVPAGARPLGDGEALTVTAGDRTFLLWGGKRLLLGRDWVADVLGLGLQAPVPVAQSWLDLVPLAGTAGPLSVPGHGRPGAAVAGRRASVGDLFRVDLGNGPVRHYLMTTDGLAPLTDTEYLLQSARPGSTGETTISPADLASAPRRTPVRPLTVLPATPPQARAVPEGAAVCVEYTGRPGSGPTVGLAAAGSTPTAAGGGTAGGVMVRVPPGGGALLLPHPEADPSRQQGALVDERGIAYPVKGSDISTLGYVPQEAVVMPPALLALLPTGPALARPDGG